MNYTISSRALLPLLAFVLAIACISCGSASVGDKQDAGYYNIDVTEFDKLRAKEGYVILDVRTPEEIAEGKVEDAEELDFYSATFQNELMTYDKDKHYLVYCRSGGRSAETADTMVKSGFKHVYNLVGGYTAWSEEHGDND